MIYLEVTLCCDVCGYLSPGDKTQHFEGIGDVMWERKREGWLFTSDRDICPDCAVEPEKKRSRGGGSGAS